MNLALISRRSTARAGTRFHSRGIDESGNVSNFVETELIVSFNHGACIFSHMQIRGSVPLFWTQKAKKQSKVTIKSTSQNKLAFTRHFDELLRKYSRVLVLNLLSQSKQDEEKLSEQMNNLLEMRNDRNVSSYSYDFHRELSNDNFD